jgi:hypothetical protein
LPRVARRWSAHEVARRWLTITKLAKCLSDDLPQPDPQRVEQLAKDKKKNDKLRRRLSNVSWFMGPGDLAHLAGRLRTRFWARRGATRFAVEAASQRMR